MNLFIEEIQTFKPVLICLTQWAIVFFRLPHWTIELVCLPQRAIGSVGLPKRAAVLVRCPEWTIGVQLESAKMAHGNEIIHRYLTIKFKLESYNIVPRPQSAMAKLVWVIKWRRVKLGNNLTRVLF